MAQEKGISACIIARNEEVLLPGCLESIKDAVDEIILVDNGSTDKTIQIAKSIGCKVIPNTWQDDFSQARNITIENATCPFILVIDADERLENPEELRQIPVSADDSTGGWLVELTSQATRPDGSLDTYISRLLRIFRNNKRIRFDGAIHEQVTNSLLSAGYQIFPSNVKIQHLGYGLDADTMQKKQNRNLNLLLKSIENEPSNSYNIYQAAKTYLALGQLKSAEKYISKAIELAPHSGSVLPQALNYGAIIAYQQGNYKLAIDRAAKSTSIIRNQSFANFILGEVYTHIDEHNRAIEHYNYMLNAMKNPDYKAQIAGEYNIPMEQAYFRLGRAFMGLQDYESAEKNFISGTKINPNDISNLIGLANVHFIRKNPEKALDYLTEANSLQPGRKDIRSFMQRIETDKKLNRLKSRIAGKKNDYSPTKPLISLAMIVKNEEKMLPGCLESVKLLVDEIVIVDTGSDDRTVEIALLSGAKVQHFKWIDDFSAARNEAIKHCSGKWILYLDADERIKIPNTKIFREFLETQPGSTGGVICTIESDHSQLDGKVEKHRGGYPRVFRNLGYPIIKFTGRVHEQITPSLREAGKSLVTYPLIIEHLGYNRSKEEMNNKVKRNYRLLLKHVKEEPVKGYGWYQLGQTLARMKLTKEAEDSIKFAIECGDLSDTVYASAASTLAQLTGNRKAFTEALKWAEKSMEKAPRQLYAHNLKAYALLHLGRKEEARTEFEAILEKLKKRKDLPDSGFDIDIPEDVVIKGLEACKSTK